MGRGAGDLPVYYEGAWDPTIPYLPRRIVTHSGEGFLSLASNLNVTPGSDPTIWFPLGSGGGWTPEAIYTGYARIASDVIPPGLRVPAACTLTEVYLRAKIAPTGASLVWLVKVNGTTVATLTLTAGSTSTSVTSLSVALAAGDIVTFDITGIGSTIAGAHLASQLIAA